MIHPGGRRPGPAPGEHRLGRFLFPLEDRFDAIVREVPDPAGEPERARLPPGIRPEIDPLDAAGDMEMIAFLHYM
jgi:hypothetical protein